MRRTGITVLVATLVALVPGALMYAYLSARPDALSRFTDGSGMAALAAALQQAPARSERPARTYVSQPMKETKGSCANSYYMSFTLALRADSFTLVKSCESDRDAPVRWEGRAQTILTDTGSSSIRLSMPLGSATGTGAVIVLAENEGRLIVEHSDTGEVPAGLAFSEMRGVRAYEPAAAAASSAGEEEKVPEEEVL